MSSNKNQENFVELIKFSEVIGSGDIIYPNNKDTTLENNKLSYAGKKRKNPFTEPDTYYKNKRVRYD